jgi:antitoxin VapB
MALSIEHPEAVVNALRERLTRQRGKSRGPRVRDELRAIRERCARYPVLDHLSADEILGYNDHGLPRRA